MEYFKDIFGIFQGYFWNISWIFLKVYGYSLEHFNKIDEIIQRYPLEYFKNILEIFRGFFGIFQGYCSEYFNNTFENISRMFFGIFYRHYFQHFNEIVGNPSRILFGIF